MQKCQRLWGCPVRRRLQGLVLLQVRPWECTIYGLISIPGRGLGEIMNDLKGKKSQTMQILSHDPVRGTALDLVVPGVVRTQVSPALLWPWRAHTP